MQIVMWQGTLSIVESYQYQKEQQEKMRMIEIENNGRKQKNVTEERLDRIERKLDELMKVVNALLV